MAIYWVSHVLFHLLCAYKLLLQRNNMPDEIRGFVCEICGKAFRFRSNLAEHRSVHTAVKPFVSSLVGLLYQQTIYYEF